MPATTTQKRILLANPRGFCAGVDRAIEIVEQALDRFGAPIYVRKEIVHNTVVVDDLAGRGAVFVDELEEVPAGSICIFSAHGVSPAVREEAKAKGLHVVDATCPLVTKVHIEVNKFDKKEYDILMIGHEGHEETEGTMGEAPHAMYLVETVEDAKTVQIRNPEKVAVVTQTTLSIDDTKQILDTLKDRFPAMAVPKKSDICYATQNRQDGVKDLAKHSDIVLIVGNRNSSNSNRLVEVAERQGTPAYLVPEIGVLELKWLENANTIGISSGASTPESAVKELIAKLAEHGYTTVDTLAGVEEDVIFSLPKKEFDAIDKARKAAS